VAWHALSTEVVDKRVAAMVLAGDNFASIGAAVKEGRTVYNDIEQAILFLLPTNEAQGLVIMVAIFMVFTMPITTPQMLRVNMVTSVALGLVCAFEPHENDEMNACRARSTARCSPVLASGAWSSPAWRCSPTRCGRSSE
jgi:magnesium-transporting ATPase (P-type)